MVELYIINVYLTKTYTQVNDRNLGRNLKIRYGSKNRSPGLGHRGQAQNVAASNPLMGSQYASSSSEGTGFINECI
jgi:hypothetical protein